MKSRIFQQPLVRSDLNLKLELLEVSNKDNFQWKMTSKEIKLKLVEYFSNRWSDITESGIKTKRAKK